MITKLKIAGLYLIRIITFVVIIYSIHYYFTSGIAICVAILFTILELAVFTLLVVLTSTNGITNPIQPINIISFIILLISIVIQIFTHTTFLLLLSIVFLLLHIDIFYYYFITNKVSDSNKIIKKMERERPDELKEIEQFVKKHKELIIEMLGVDREYFKQ